MKVLRGAVASIAIGAASMVLRHQAAAAEAECPTECRYEVNAVVCFEVVTQIGDLVIDRKTYYWSKGAGS